MPFLLFLALVVGLPVAGFAVSREAGLVAAGRGLVTPDRAISPPISATVERRRRR